MGHLCDKHNVFDGKTEGCPSCAEIKALLLQQWDTINISRRYLQIRIENLRELAKNMQRQEVEMKKDVQRITSNQ